MRVVSISAAKEEQDFAKKAAEHFDANPRHYTFAHNDPKQSEFLAVRWNSFTVLVVKLDEVHEPACYPVHQFIGKDLPPLKGDPQLSQS